MHLRSLTEADLHIMVIHDTERNSNVNMRFPKEIHYRYLYYLYIVSLPIQKFPLFMKKVHDLASIQHFSDHRPIRISVISIKIIDYRIILSGLTKLGDVYSILFHSHFSNRTKV